MFAFSSSHFLLFGNSVTYYAVLPVPGVLLAAGMAALFCVRKGWPARPTAYAAGIVYSVATVLRLYQNSIPEALLSFMVLFSTAGIAAAAYMSSRLFRLPQVHVCAAFTMPMYMGMCKLGCFLTGCCVGVPYDGPLAVYYGEKTICMVRGVSLFPVQLLTAVLLFIAAGAAYAVLDRRQDMPTYLAVCAFTPLVYYSCAALCDRRLIADVMGRTELFAAMALISLVWMIFWMIKANRHDDRKIK